jgi:hypothetical protein
MPMSRIRHARRSWLAILPVLPYLVLTLAAGGIHHHRLLLPWWGTQASRADLVGAVAAQPERIDQDACAACEWLLASTACGPSLDGAVSASPSAPTVVLRVAAVSPSLPSLPSGRAPPSV